nr:reverse transcriptase domain-containing protein [Tanacetum cinerariifolium]
MPPRRLRKKYVKKLVERRVAKAIEEYEKTRADSINAGGSGSTSTRGSADVQGCSYKTFINCKPHSFNETGTLTLKGDDIEAYNNRFHELALMCPELVPTERKKIEKATRIGESNKRKWEDHQRNTTTTTNNNNNNCNRNNNYNQQQNRRQETARAYDAALAEGRGYVENLPKCNRYNFHHNGQCPPTCPKCQRTGHREKDCRFRVPGAGVTPCGMCLVMNVVKRDISRTSSQKEGTSRMRELVQELMWWLKSAAESEYGRGYEVELAGGKVVSTNTILRGCTLALYDHRFKIDLLPTRLGSFDIIIGMDCLSYHRAVIDCYEKIVCIPLPNGEILEVHGERPEKDPRSFTCIKADEKKLDDIRVVQDFPKIFPDDLSGLPPVREIEFRNDLILGALPVVKSPYRLAPSEMSEMSNQLKEL